ncbi:MAG: 1-deoxy-D-xylulose-5-phosphate synthase [Planctomycetota bacterium]|nr:MAG: 1-deoxy-D-xylulose-5-phosphate synthase [Planctomycetota bacterium]
MTRILPTVTGPQDLRTLTRDQLVQLATEIRERIIEVVGRNGGHLASNLGVVELTMALHCVFDFKTDRLLWDVGHQAYVHKLLTGRNARFDTLRKAGGISGFPNTAESEYDLFNVGHAGTAIPTAVGMARGASLVGEDRRVVAVVGDASIFNGVAFEGLNQAGTLRRQLLVVLNDNSMGIAPTQGGMAEYLAKFRVSTVYEDLKRGVKRYLPQVPVIGKPAFNALDHLKDAFKATLSPHQIFEQLGFVYVGPTDGHDLEHMIELLQLLRDVQHPVLLHVHTQKGKGAEWALADPTKFHSPKPFKVEGCRVEIQKGGVSYTAAFADALIKLAQEDTRVFALTAAMPDGTGLNKFQQLIPERFLDGGIAESATVDIAAGMCKAGVRPVAAIYSTFLQRAFDQVFQEVTLQGLPVIFGIDRAGLVGGDGPVHHGFADIAYLRVMPNMVLMAPGDGPEIEAALRLALSLDTPSAVRYPRDTVPEPLFKDGATPPFELGRSVRLREGQDATVLAYGSTCRAAMEAAGQLAAQGIEVRVVNARFAKPVDRVMVSESMTRGGPVVTVEDHSVAGGFGSAILEAARDIGLAANHVVLLGIPENRFIAHGSRAGQLAEVGIDADGIARAVREALGAPPTAGGATLQRHRDLSYVPTVDET